MHARIDHQHWACPICAGEGCRECGYQRTVHDYWAMQELGFAALKDEPLWDVFEMILAVPEDHPMRAYAVAHLMALAQQRMRWLEN